MNARHQLDRVTGTTWALALRLGGILALARLSIFGYLLFRDRAGTYSIELILLVLALYLRSLSFLVGPSGTYPRRCSLADS